MKVILITIMLTGCAGFGGVKEITLDNALKECKYFGVNVKTLPEIMPELTINVVGKEINNYCESIACLINGKHIYLKHDDWLAKGHEVCHALDYQAKHVEQRRQFESLESIFKDR